MNCSVPVCRNCVIKGRITPLKETARGKIVLYKLADIFLCLKSRRLPNYKLAGWDKRKKW